KRAIADRDLAGIFPQTEAIDLSPRSISYAIGQLRSVSLAETDAKGMAFQAILGPQIRGEKGQFFTPDPVKRLLMAITDPAPTESTRATACGSGGLLVEAIEYVRKKEALKRKFPVEPRVQDARQKKALAEAVREYATERVMGVEIDPALVRVARLNMMMHG